MGLLIVGVITTSLHKINPAWISLALMFVFLAIGTLGRKDFQRKMDWPFLFMLGTLLGLANAISHLGLDDLVGRQLGPMTDLIRGNIYLFVLALAALIFVIRIALSINATVVVVASVFLPISASVGFNPWVMGFLILTLSESFVLPYQSSYYLQMRSFNEQAGLYDEGLFLRFNLWGYLVRILAIYASIPFWQAMEPI